jgi:hypothetical protein
VNWQSLRWSGTLMKLVNDEKISPFVPFIRLAIAPFVG